MTIRGMDTEVAKQPPDGCVRCRRSWPNATFSQFNEAVARGEKPEYVCDLCLEFPVDEVSQAIDEAQGVERAGISREVKVTGVESQANLIAWRFLTHQYDLPLSFTDLYVEFKNSSQYVYRNVPTAVCEGMIAAPSRGSYFAEQIKTSYQCEKVK